MINSVEFVQVSRQDAGSDKERKLEKLNGIKLEEQVLLIPPRSLDYGTYNITVEVRCHS